MDNPMTLHDELAGLAAKASGNLWVLGRRANHTVSIDAPNADVPWQGLAQVVVEVGKDGKDYASDPMGEANAALIVALKNNLPAILSALKAADEVKRLREENELLREMASDYRVPLNAALSKDQPHD